MLEHWKQLLLAGRGAAAAAAGGGGGGESSASSSLLKFPARAFIASSSFTGAAVLLVVAASASIPISGLKRDFRFRGKVGLLFANAVREREKEDLREHLLATTTRITMRRLGSGFTPARV